MISWKEAFAVYYSDYSQGLGLASSHSSTIAKVQAAAHPVFEKLGKMPTFHPCTSASNYFHGVADLSMSVRNFSQLDFTNLNAAPNNKADPFIGLTSVMYLPIGLGELKDAVKQMKIASKIGDKSGLILGAIQTVKKVGLTVGAAMLGVDRVSSIAGKTTAASIGQAMGALFGIYYAFSFGTSVMKIGQLQSLMGELEGGAALEALREKLQVSDDEIEDADFRDEALSAGTDWLAKVFKEFDKEQLDMKGLSGEQKKTVVEKLFKMNPEILRSTLGAKANGLSTNQLIEAFGREVKRSKVQMKKEEELGRVIGKELVEKIKGGTVTGEQIMEQLKVQRGQEAFAAVLCLIGAAASLMGMFAGGIPNFVGSLLWAVSGIGWFFHSEGHLTIERLLGTLASTEVGKYDKWIILSSILLNTAALVGAIHSIFSNGADASGWVSLAMFISVGMFWAIVSLKAYMDRSRYFNQPWEFEKVPTMHTFQMLLKSDEIGDKIKAVYEKMKEVDKAVINSYKVENREQLIERIEKQLDGLRKQQLHSLKSLRHQILHCAAATA